MKTLTCAVVALSMAVSSAPAGAATTSIVQSLANANAVYTTTFTLTVYSEISIQTWGYAGGTNAGGVVIPGGGFDPAVALFLGTGSSATLYDFNDDGFCPPGRFDATSGQCLDSTLMEIGAAPGTYTLVLMASPNQPSGSTLGDGFAGGGSFTDVFGDVRTGNFAVDIVTTPSMLAQTITFGVLSNRGLGTGNFALNASSSSALPVVFASNTQSVCTVSGANVTLLALGTCSITASQPGNSTYAPADAVTQTFLIYIPPSVTIESPVANATLRSSAMIGGWALENTSVVGPYAVASVAVFVDGTQVGTAHYGLSRTNVCPTYPGRLGCPNVGWSYTLDVTPYSAGSHTLSVVATDSAGNTGSSQVTFNMAEPSVNIDSPSADATLAGVVPIGGWALESAASAGPYAIASVAVLVDSIQVGTATYGSPRSDVCSVYPGRIGCPNVGWSYNLDVSSLTADIHTLKILATDTAGNPGSSQLAFFSIAQTSANPQTIAFAPLGNVASGAAPFTLTATASSGLAVAFTSSTPAVCTVSGSTVAILGAGTCSIVASQTGNAIYAAAPSVLRSFTVGATSKCDVNGDQAVNVVDVQLIINEALGIVPAVHDLSGDGLVNVVDVQIVINAALGLGCSAK